MVESFQLPAAKGNYRVSFIAAMDATDRH